MIEAPSETDRIIAAAEARERRWLASREVPIPRAKRNHTKRHSVNRRRHQEAVKKRKAAAAAIEDNLRRLARFRDITRAYWAGEVDDLRGLPR